MARRRRSLVGSSRIAENLYLYPPALLGAKCRGRGGRPIPLLCGARAEDGNALCTKRRTVSCPYSTLRDSAPSRRPRRPPIVPRRGTQGGAKSFACGFHAPPMRNRIGKPHKLMPPMAPPTVNGSAPRRMVAALRAGVQSARAAPPAVSPHEALWIAATHGVAAFNRIDRRRQRGARKP